MCAERRQGANVSYMCEDAADDEIDGAQQIGEYFSVKSRYVVEVVYRNAEKHA